jgi:hypothetical protein
MISIGYYFDQVSRERMVQRIAEQVNLIADSTPTTRPLRHDEVVWVETAHPNYHELDVRWMVDGREVTSAQNSRYLDLGRHGSARALSVTVSDPTPFVRDPAIRNQALTATRSWTVEKQMFRAEVIAAFEGSTATDRPVAGTEVVYVVTSQSPHTVFDVAWSLNDKPLKIARSARTLPLASLKLAPGTHRLRAVLAGRRAPDGLRQGAGGARGNTRSREWTVDNTMPTVKYTLSTPVEAKTEANGTPHYVFDEEFTMKLEPSDDQKGYVVAEFRVNGDGWHHYYGWPDAPEGTPYKVTPRRTTIKDLVYGSLSIEGLSPQPWEPRKPGYGTHRIEYRAIDAAGNIGPARTFMVTVK